jgi:ABC-type Mn2+/Zn2+ transport system ATPase subunit
VEYNIAFYDEILDSSVDNKSLEHIIDFIAEKAANNGKSIYIVTHKTDIMMPQLTETVLLEKRNGFTRRIEN